MNKLRIVTVIIVALAGLGVWLWPEAPEAQAPAAADVAAPPAAATSEAAPPPLQGEAEDEPDAAPDPIDEAKLLAIEAARDKAEDEATEDLAEAQDEAVSYLGGMRVASLAYYAAFKELVDTPPCPAGSPTDGPHDWAGPCTEAWNDLGWAPSPMEVDTGTRQATLCQYEIKVSEDGQDIEAISRCDGDRDGVMEVLTTTLDDDPAAVD